MKKESGAILAISLIILLVVTTIVISSTQSGVLQEKMSAAAREGHISLEIAESGIRDAEKMIETLTSTTAFNSSGNGGLYSQDSGPNDLFDTSIWSDSVTISATTVISGQTARYSIEELGLLPMPDEDLSTINMMGYGETTGGGDVHVFKIVSRSMGSNANSERIIVSYYGKRF